MKKLAIVIAVLSLFSSCSCEWYLSKAEQQCGKITRTDTIQTTITTTLTTKDTVFHFTKSVQRDTIYIKKNNLIEKFYYNVKDSTIYLNGNCEPEVIQVSIPWTYDQIAYDVWKKYKRYIIWALVALGIFLAIRIIIKITTPKQIIKHENNN
jgi:hypothetical protein